ncbi:FK506-binding protein 4-like [Helianthus annuus]|uniref:FK506-binding protein 4-like n=1 Tax=Helianthus annuus TaxID=4232 RepID=UPI000B906390|nr:FK506-binding protein 4-like [Helianthus annuus]
MEFDNIPPPPERKRVISSRFDDSKDDEEDDKENEYDEEQDTDELFKDIDDYHYDGNDDDDDDDGNSGAIVVSRTGDHQDLDFLDDTHNEEVEDVHPQGESSSGTKHSSTPKVIFLQHDVEEGELVVNWTREPMKEALGMNDEDKFTFDFEKDIEYNAPDDEYVFKMVDDADNFNDVVTEDDSDSDHEEQLHYSDNLKRQIVEKLGEEGIPRKLSKEELREERKKWFKPMPGEHLKTFPCWDVKELVKMKNIQQLEWGPKVRYYESKLWYYIHGQARDHFPEWKP